MIIPYSKRVIFLVQALPHLFLFILRKVKFIRNILIQIIDCAIGL